MLLRASFLGLLAGCASANANPGISPLPVMCWTNNIGNEVVVLEPLMTLLEDGRLRPVTIGLQAANFVGTQEQYRDFVAENARRVAERCSALEADGKECQIPVVEVELPDSIYGAEVIADLKPGDDICGVAHALDIPAGHLTAPSFFVRMVVPEAKPLDDIFGSGWYTTSMGEWLESPVAEFSETGSLNWSQEGDHTIDWEIRLAEDAVIAR